MTVLLAGLAANSIGSLVKGLMPLRASVAGLLTSGYLDKARNDKLPEFVQLLIANRRHMFDHGLHIILGTALDSAIASINCFLVIFAIQAPFQFGGGQ